MSLGQAEDEQQQHNIVIQKLPGSQKAGNEKPIKLMPSSEKVEENSLRIWRELSRFSDKITTNASGLALSNLKKKLNNKRITEGTKILNQIHLHNLYCESHMPKLINCLVIRTTLCTRESTISCFHLYCTFSSTR